MIKENIRGGDDGELEQGFGGGHYRIPDHGGRNR
jgi:hypothetical protein